MTQNLTRLAALVAALALTTSLSARAEPLGCPPPCVNIGVDTCPLVDADGNIIVVGVDTA
jgi:hypothetical protein